MLFLINIGMCCSGLSWVNVLLLMNGVMGLIWYDIFLSFSMVSILCMYGEIGLLMMLMGLDMVYFCEVGGKVGRV